MIINPLNLDLNNLRTASPFKLRFLSIIILASSSALLSSLSSQYLSLDSDKTGPPPWWYSWKIWKDAVYYYLIIIWLLFLILSYLLKFDDKSVPKSCVWFEAYRKVRFKDLNAWGLPSHIFERYFKIWKSPKIKSTLVISVVSSTLGKNAAQPPVTRQLQDIPRLSIALKLCSFKSVQL